MDELIEHRVKSETWIVTTTNDSISPESHSTTDSWPTGFRRTSLGETRLRRFDPTLPAVGGLPLRLLSLSQRPRHSRETTPLPRSTCCFNVHPTLLSALPENQVKCSLQWARCRRPVNGTRPQVTLCQ